MSVSLRETEELKKIQKRVKQRIYFNWRTIISTSIFFLGSVVVVSLVYSRRIIYFFKKPLSFASNKSRPDLGSIEITHVRSSLSHLSGIKESK